MIRECSQKSSIIRIHNFIKQLRLALSRILLFINQKVNIANLFAVFTSYLTDIAPNWGRIISNTMVKYLFANKVLFSWQLKKNQTLAISSKLDKVLIISDLNIGDAINLQLAAYILKKINAKHIDYVINKTAYPLIKHNPHISHTFPLFSRPNFVSNEEIYYLNSIIKQNDYDLVLNFCPFLSKHSINSKNFINYIGLSIYIANNYFNQKTTHVTYATWAYLNKIFSTHIPFEGNFLYLSSASIQEAKNFYEQIPKNAKTIFFNIDATSKYTLMPLSMQLYILEQLSRLKDTYIIISASFSQQNLQEKIYKSLKNTYNVFLINKNMPIDTYASLIDFCDCFVSSDTGGLHIAASYKFDEYNRPLNNKTAIFSIFGATPAAIYAYDSCKEHFLKSSQNAISKVYISKNPCKNITCINKAAKKCKSVRCFNGINYQEIVTDIKNYLGINA